MDNEVLRRYFDAIKELREALESNAPLDGLERLRLENYMSVLHMSYVEWKRRNIAPNPPYWGSPYLDTDQDESFSSNSH